MLIFNTGFCMEQKKCMKGVLKFGHLIDYFWKHILLYLAAEEMAKSRDYNVSLSSQENCSD